MTTTNGTRALRACAGAQAVWIGSFLNLRVISNRLKAERPPHVLLVCSGTGEQPALEDLLRRAPCAKGSGLVTREAKSRTQRRSRAGFIRSCSTTWPKP